MLESTAQLPLPEDALAVVARPEGSVVQLGSPVAAAPDVSELPYLFGASFRLAPVGAGRRSRSPLPKPRAVVAWHRDVPA